MNEAKRRQLMKAARAVPPVSVPAGFREDVLRAIRQTRSGRTESSTVFDQLAVVFPRLAAAALLVIVAALAFEYFSGGDMISQFTEASDQWLLPMDWL